MKNLVKLYLIIAFTIIIFDIVASFASRTLRFDYTDLALVSWGLYVASGYFGHKYYSILGGVGAGGVAGLTDSTIGWAASIIVSVA